jgi:hypothetical protein
MACEHMGGPSLILVTGPAIECGGHDVVPKIRSQPPQFELRPLKFELSAKKQAC